MSDNGSNGNNGNGNGRLDGDLEAGAPVSPQFQAGTPPPNVQQALQGGDGQEAVARKANLRSGVLRLVRSFFAPVKTSLEASRPLLQEPNGGVVGGQEGVGRAAGGRPGDYGQRAQEEGEGDKISDWFNKMESKKDVLQKEGAVREDDKNAAKRFVSSRVSSSDSQNMDLSKYALFGFDRSEFLEATVSGQASATGTNRDGQSPDTVVVVSSTSASEISSPGGSQGNSPGQ